jgi:hypothetical protein
MAAMVTAAVMTAAVVATATVMTAATSARRVVVAHGFFFRKNLK